MKKNPFLFLILFALFITGCAVITVDVDVYTGPLSNTEEVQTEQVISLVMGARPLLVQLRDHLEVASWTPHPIKTHAAEDSLQHNSSLQEKLVKFRDNNWYWAGFIAASLGSEQRLVNEHAIIVNDILVLYEDRTPESLAALVSRGREIYQRYLTNYAILFPKNNSEEKKAWEAIQKGMTDPKAASAYKLFFVSDKGRRLTAGVLERLNTMAKQRIGVATAKKFSELNVPAIAYFRTNDVIRAETATLFGEGFEAREARERFVRESERLLHAYDECRSALHDLAILSLRGMQEVERSSFASTRDSNTVTRIIAGFASSVIAPPKGWSGDLPEGCLTNGLIHSNLTMKCLNSFSNGKAARAILEDSLIRAPRGVATDLLMIDQVLNEKGENITSGYISMENARLPGDLGQELAYLEQAAGSALNGGRDPQGLETLIEQYLEAYRKSLTSTSRLSRAQIPEFTRLMGGLLAFAQKVTTLGNTAFLVDSGQSGEIKRYVSVLQYIGNSTLVHVDELKGRKIHDDRLKANAVLMAQALTEAGFTNISAFTNATRLRDLDAKDVLAHLLDSIRAQYIKAILDQPPAIISEMRGNTYPTNLNAILATNNVTVIFTNAALTATSVGSANTNVSLLTMLGQIKGEANLTASNISLVATNSRLTASNVMLVATQSASLVTFTQASLTSTNAMLTASNAILSATNISTLAGAPPSSIALTNATLAASNASVTAVNAQLGATNVTVLVSQTITLTNPAQASLFSSNVSAVVSGAALAASNATLTAAAAVTITNAQLIASNALVLQSNVVLHVPGIPFAATNRISFEPPSDKFLKAINEVLLMKNNQIYLRPASAYLRSSYPATTYNLNESVGWGNQLERQAWRSMPLIGDVLDASGKSRLKQLRETDKQSWQNINRVRVSGVGRVNNVLAKDDVGNWYVKQYSADPTNIIRSARNLAMFSAGNSFGRPLSILGPDGKNLVATNSPFAGQFNKAASNYVSRTTATWESLTNRLLNGSLVSGVAGAWSKQSLSADTVTSLTSNMVKATNLYSTAITQGGKNISKASVETLPRVTDTEILNVMHAVKRFHDAVRPKLEGTNATITATARGVFTSHVREFLDSSIEERTDALNRFDSAIDVIRGATSN